MQYSSSVSGTNAAGTQQSDVASYLASTAVQDLMRQAKVLNDAIERLAPDNDRYFVLSAERRAVLEALYDIGG